MTEEIKKSKIKVLPSSCNNCAIVERRWWPNIGWVEVHYAPNEDCVWNFEISEEDLIEIPEKDEVL